jgi:HemK-like putative methylase
MRGDMSNALSKDEFKLLSKYSKGDPDTLKRWCSRKLYGEPIPYVVGKIEIMGRSFLIDRRAFVPDPLTPSMIGKVCEEVGQKSCTLVEVGTGCGWIAITLALENPNCRVIASDIDPNALALARENAELHGASVEFVESYYLDSIEASSVDYLIANLPYGDPPSEELILRSAHPHAQMPEVALYHPDGPYNAMIELFESLDEKKWQPLVYVETGSSSEHALRNALPNSVKFTYHSVGKYSFITINHE